MHGRVLFQASLKEVASKAYQQYVRSRPTPSAESVKRVKSEGMLTNIAYHPIFLQWGSTKADEATEQKLAAQQASLLSSLKNYKPQVVSVFRLLSVLEEPDEMAFSDGL